MKNIIFNPDYYFVDDNNRISLRSGRNANPLISDISWLSFIHPFQAYLLSLFSEPNSLETVALIIQKDFNIEHEVIINLLSSFINNKTPIYTSFQGKEIRFPKNVLLNYDGIMKYDYFSSKRKINIEDYASININLEVDRIQNAPRSLLYMITNRCKTRCGYCYANTSQKFTELSLEQIELFFLDAKNVGVEYIDIIGGEIFCHKQWAEILSLLVKLNMSPSFISTKIPLKENDIIKLKDTGYTGQIQISLDSLNDETLSQIICAPKGYSDQIKKSINLLIKYDFKVQINTVLTKKSCNPKEMDNLFCFISALSKISYWEIRVPEVSIYNYNKFKLNRPDLKEIKECLKYIQNKILPFSQVKIIINDDALHVKLRCYDETCNFFPGGNCGLLKENLFILPDGKVSVCEQLYCIEDFIIGDIKSQSIREIWQSKKADDLYNNIINLYKKKRSLFEMRIFRNLFKKKAKMLGKNS